jgi:hypothetical protein
MDTSLRQELQRRFVQFQDELWRPLHADPPRLLYHYSSPAGVRGILETRELWVSDIRGLNDTREGTYSADVFGPILRRKSVPDQIQPLFNREVHQIGKIWVAYVASFCGAKDLDNQWNSYAEVGAGCALTVDLERLIQSGAPDAFAVFRVLYDAAEQKAKAEATIDHAIHLSRELDIRKKDSGEFWVEALIYSLLPCGVRFKDPCWAAEQEWRVLMIRPDRRNALERTLPVGWQTWYLRIALDSSLLKSVLLGPRCAFTAEEMRELLSAHGMADVSIVPTAG